MNQQQIDKNMKNLNTEQVANFAYWLTETNDNRGIAKFNGLERVLHIENVLLPEFLKKYPTGILTGWNKTIKSSVVEIIHSITKNDWILITNFAENRKNEPFYRLRKTEGGAFNHISDGYASVGVYLSDKDNRIHVCVRRNGKNNVEGQSEITKILLKYDLQNIIFDTEDH